ncbi:MAG: hypothetical protein ACYSUC_11920 [Planctomycetota bacterium]|jgi:hypothetical protein
MNEFVKQNKKLLQLYCLAARIIGWVLLLTPPALIALVLLWSRLGEPTDGRQLPPPDLSLSHIAYFMLGLVVLGIGQFIRYLFQTEGKPGWILRNGDKILYLYAVFTVVLAWSTVRMMFYFGREFPIKHLIHMGFLWIPVAFAKALVLIGLAHILRRVLPVIEESKTLV